MDTVTAVIPCRKGSTRMGFDKQLANFAGTTLMDIKVNQLLKSKYITNIVLSTDDQNILNRYNHKKIKAFKRDSLILHSTDANTMVDVCLQHVDEGVVIITHCTSPFFDEYDNAIKIFRSTDCDSLLTARKIGSFVFDPNINNVVNCDRTIEKWPKTQDLPLWYEFDSAIEPIMTIDTMRKVHDKLGENPYFYITNALQSIDIDYKEEWELAEKLWKALN